MLNLEEGEEELKTMQKHGKKNRNYWVDIILVDLAIFSMISALLLLNSLIPYTYPQNEPYEGGNVVNSQDKDYNIHILTDNELSQLYTCKPDYRLINTRILEFSYEDAQLMMKVGRAEGGPTLLGQLWVMGVLVNRLFSPKFPDNMQDIINQDGQFEVVEKKMLDDAEINANTHLALAMIESGWNETCGALWFEASSNTENSWHAQNLTFVKEVEGQRYYK